MMLYIGSKTEIVRIIDPTHKGHYWLVQDSKGLQWFASKRRLFKLTPLMEALC
jgi:hypothetical protein